MLTFARTAEGEIVSVAQLAALKEAGQRPPPCFCPSCSHQLIPKLGEKVTHHLAHRPELEPCFGSTGEGELHISAKLFLERELQRMAAEGETLHLGKPCGECAEWMAWPALPLQPGDRVTVESWLDPRKTLKPDVTLWRGETRLLLLEVLVTHACGPEKLAALRGHGVPMVETEARLLLDRARAGGGPLCLPVARSVLLPTPTICEACQERRRVEAQRQQAQAAAQQQARQEYLATPRVDVVMHCHVGYYFPDGGRRRQTLLLVRHWLGEEWNSVELVEAMTGRVLAHWPRAEVLSLQRLYEDKVRVLAKAYCRSVAGPGTVLQTNGGFRVGDGGDAPLPAFWWDVKGRAWVKAQMERGLARRLGIHQETIERMVARGQLRRVEVRAYATAETSFRAIYQDGIDRFLEWRRQKRGPALDDALRRGDGRWS